MAIMSTIRVLVTAVVVTVITYLVRLNRARTARESILGRLPLLDASTDDALAITHQGYVKYVKNGKAYRLRTDPAGVHDRVILPFKYLDEVKDSPENELSFTLFSKITTMLQYSGSPEQTLPCTHAMRHSLNQNLSRFTSTIHAGVANDLANILPTTHDWFPMTLYPALVTVIARNASRVLGDTRLSKNDEWVNLTIKITEQTWTAAASIRSRFGPSTFWLAKYLDTSSKKIQQLRRRAAEILEPFYQEHKAALRKSGQSDSSTGLTWLLAAPDRSEPSAQEVTDDLLFLSMAGIHTTTASLMTMICDLIIRPEIYSTLRQEINSNYPSDGCWTPAKLSQLPLLDSFMKESQRFNYIGLHALSRAPQQGYKFSDGLEIPAMTIVQMASHELNKDPDVHADPNTFDAKRFCNLNEVTGSGKYSYASISNDYSIVFGAGLHSCPGRNFASMTMKIALAQLLTCYDVGIDEEKGPPQWVVSGLARMVDPRTTLMVRRLANAKSEIRLEAM